MQFETDLEFDDDTHKVAYEYNELGRITGRTLTNGSSTYGTTYTFVAGGYGTNSTTPLVAGISQGSGDNAMNFAYAYDSRGFQKSLTFTPSRQSTNHKEEPQWQIPPTTSAV